MSDFQQILTESLVAVNAAFETADADLNRIIADAADAVASVSEGKVNLGLMHAGETVGGRHYQLTVYGPNSSQNVGGLRIPPSGYPIRFNEKTALSGPKEVEGHLAEMMRNPDSPLTTHLAYAMRQVKAESAGSS